MSFFQRITVVRPGAPGPDNRGVYCTKEGVFIGNGCQLVLAQKGCLCGGERYRVRPAAEIKALLDAAQGGEADLDYVMAQLKKIASYLGRGELNLAQIATLYLGLPDLRDALAIARLHRADDLLKAGFNPDEPRDSNGRWTADGANSPVALPAAAADGRAIPNVVPSSRTNDVSRPSAVQVSAPQDQSREEVPVMRPRKLTPECEDEWDYAEDRCEELSSSGQLGIPHSWFGRSFDECVRGYVSMECGGNPV